MNEYLGRKINSSLFMEDPSVPNAPAEEKILTKGKNKKDVIVVESINGSFQFHRKSFKSILKDLKPYATVSVKNLTHDTSEAFKSVIEAIRLLHEHKEVYSLVLKDIQKLYGNIKNIQPGTLGSYFVGCFNDDKFTGPLGCSPKCVSSLDNNDCDDLVLIYENNSFSALNEKRTTHAYIYIGDAKFTAFNEENISQLKEAGINSITLVIGNPDGTYKEVSSPIPVNNAPVSGQSKVSVANTTNTEPINTAGLVIVIILLIVLIAAIGFILWKAYKDKL